MTKLKINLPRSEKFFSNLLRAIHNAAKRNESLTTIWIPMSGKKFTVQFLIKNKEPLLPLCPQFKNYHLIAIHPNHLTELNPKGYLKIMLKNLLKTTEGWEERKAKIKTETIEDCLDSFDQVLSKINKKIIFFIDEIDELEFGEPILYNALSFLQEKHPEKISYTFMATSDIAQIEKINKFGGLISILFKNLYYVPLPKGKDYGLLIKNISLVKKYKTNLKVKKIIQELCGNHPALVVEAIRLLSINRKIKTEKEIEKLINTSPGLVSMNQSIVGHLEPKFKELLKTISNQEIKILPEWSKNFLEKTNFVNKTKEGNYKINNKIITHFFQDQQLTKTKKGSLFFNPQTKNIYYQGKNINEKLTPQEQEIFSLLIQNKNNICSRDQIAKTLWSNEKAGKYGNWAIDKLISKLRKKTLSLGLSKDQLKTIRKRGYILST